MTAILDWLFNKESGQAVAFAVKMIVSILAAHHFNVTADQQVQISVGIGGALSWLWHKVENKIGPIVAGSGGAAPSPGSAV